MTEEILHKMTSNMADKERITTNTYLIKTEGKSIKERPK
jgi:hypothetical protein